MSYDDWKLMTPEQNERWVYGRPAWERRGLTGDVAYDAMRDDELTEEDDDDV